MKLWDVPVSGNCKKVRIAARELGIELERMSLDPSKGENQRPEYVEKNPMGKVPTIEDDGFVLWESAAIVVYLAKKLPAKRLLPADPRGEADALRWLFWGASHVGPNVQRLGQERVYKARLGGGPPDPAIVAAAEKELARFVPVLEQQLASQPHVLGRDYSVADIVLGCTFESARMVQYDLAPFPAIRAWLERLQARPAWRE